MAFNFSLKRARKRGKALIKRGSTAIKKFQEEAPQRRSEEITKLKHEIQIAKLKKQRNKLTETNERMF